MLHLCVYLVFFVIVFTNYGLPLHLVSFFAWLLLLLMPADATNLLHCSQNWLVWIDGKQVHQALF